MHSFAVISENIIVNHILPKSRCFGLHFVHKLSNVKRCDVIGPKATELGKITPNNDHYAVQGESKVTTFGGNQ